MSKNIVITGASGLIGTNLARVLINRGDNVYIFTRSADKTRNIIHGAAGYIEWDYKKPGKWAEYLNGKDAVIHLAGANISGKRWSEHYKEIILKSRQLSTGNLVNVINSLPEKPGTFICASGVNYYGDSGNKSLTEEEGPGNDFLANVCKIWEEEAQNVEKTGVRRISVRTGVVLTPEEGALKKMLITFKLFIGGPLGSGHQWFPWIHLDDIVNIYVFLLDNNNLNGAFNACSPNPVTMNQFAKILGKVMNRPAFFKVPEFALTLAAGEIADIITASLKVIPKKLLEQRYKFKFENLKDALADLF
ncbi:MAG: TIGR01777 family oxidoreductase [Ignavibacteriaceae bacterium]